MWAFGLFFASRQAARTIQQQKMAKQTGAGDGKSLDQSLCRGTIAEAFETGVYGWASSMFALDQQHALPIGRASMKAWRGNDQRTQKGKWPWTRATLRCCWSRLLHWIFGDRMVMDYADHSFFTSRNGKYGPTLLLPVFILVLVTDFFLECDVTLTKLETLSDKYIEWTSSAFAAFALPEFFFVVRFLCDKYFALPYGIAFVLIFFGTELMLCDLVVIPGIVGISIILSVVFICIVVSILLTEKEFVSKDPDFTPKPEKITEASFGPAGSLLEDSGKNSKCVIH